MRKSLKNKGIFERISFKERVILENRYCVDKKKVKDIAIELDRSFYKERGIDQVYPPAEVKKMLEAGEWPSESN